MNVLDYKYMYSKEDFSFFISILTSMHEKDHQHLLHC